MKKIIPNTENMYYASDDGKIFKSDIEVAQHKDRPENGYMQCAIKINGKYQKQKVHRLVAVAFLGEVKGLTVNHINGDKYDNNVANLEIITHAENMAHAKNLPSYKSGRTKCEKSHMKLNDTQLQELLSCGDCMSLAEMSLKFNIGKTTVSDYFKRAGVVRKNKRVN